MTSPRSAESIRGLVRELCKLPRETEWVELKRNDGEPQRIGEYLSGLSNAAALAGKAWAYVVWGVDDATHDIVGTHFSPSDVRVGNEELENWLLRLLSPRIDFRFHETEIEGHPVVVLEIGCAFRHPVRFSGGEFIRVGSYLKPLKDYPEKERALWRVFDSRPFESGIAAEGLPVEEVLRRLDVPSYFELLEQPLPESHAALIDTLAGDRLVAPCEAGGWKILNLGAALLARDLGAFPGLGRKAVRVIVYRGRGRLVTEREHVEVRGYACAFEALVLQITTLLPAAEVIEQARRRTVPLYPEAAIREIVANALIHQDFTVTGAGPMVEIFDDRIEVTNPGEPLVAADRFLDSPPTSRNEALASLMRRFRICEERGSGVDKIVSETEKHQLPGPLFEAPLGFTRVVLFAPRPLASMDRDERIRACYLHACLRYVQRDFLTNTSLRERFRIEAKNSATASRLIREAIEAGALLPFDSRASRQQMKYIPWWARGGARVTGRIA
jgi:ATP-dependent DNA helicase RecG